ncbi:DUF1232 domain-containing protein [Frigoriglobus tundricola]|uniref:DUF1232 domain-containing protein n=1 Tax=Frigoriglobus tundricola TaxID=2774151 RepID=A0A6M5YNB1_9BACT|nr:DUF1232 domain-containing protein [Frigoriglobus tundricola]QJW95408.1 hypothetical protein FTUN_2957 [Frigoriglobus tundricola]
MSLLDMCSLAFGGFFLLAALSLVLMHLPNSPLRTIALRASAGLFAVVFAPAYVVSPVDILPEAVLGPIGLIDDIGVIIAGVAAGRYALKGPDKEHIRDGN